jgi:zinc/manganese transport system substrate-binding protein
MRLSITRASTDLPNELPAVPKPERLPNRRLFALVALLLVPVLLAAACGSDGSGGTTTATSTAASSGTSEKRQVVAAENFWGSIASQVGGDRVSVTAIITSPDTDPHAYEATPADGRSLASAKYVIYNGVCYDPWVG